MNYTLLIVFECSTATLAGELNHVSTSCLFSFAHFVKDEEEDDDEAAGAARGPAAGARSLWDTGARVVVCRCVADFVKSLDAWKEPARRRRSAEMGL